MNNILNKKTENFSIKKIDWTKIQLDMREKLGNDIYESWLKKIDFIEEFNNYILISVSTRFIRDWITSRYLDQILQIIKTHKKEIDRIEFTILEQKKNKVINENKANKINSEGNEKVSFIEALGIAGDMNITANLSDARIYRETSDSLITRHIDLSTDEIFSSEYFMLKQNDIIYIPPNKTKSRTSKYSPIYIPLLTSVSLLLTTINIFLSQ